MKITTKTGDSGETGLLWGRRVKKSSPVIDALGDLDELNTFLGWCKLAVKEEASEQVMGLFVRFQDEVYRIMGIIGYELKCPEMIDDISMDHVEALEKEIEERESVVADLKEFVKPGTTEEAARIQMARAVCRRAERSYLRYFEEISEGLGAGEKARGEVVLKYLNRLSDLLFVLAYGFEV